MQHFDVFWTDQAGSKVAEVARREETGRVRLNADADLPVGAEILVHDVPDWVDPYQHRVLVERAGKPLGLFLVGAEGLATKRSDRQHRLTLLDPLKLADTYRLTKPVTVAAGVNVVNKVAELVKLTGETRLAVTPSDAVTPAPQVWMPGETTLKTVVNDLLGSINYWGLHTNRLGEFVIAPYVLPTERGVMHEFIAGDGSKLLGEYDSERDFYAVPNRFIAVCDDYRPQGNDDADPVTLVGVAENRNPDSPFSFEARGNRWVDEYDQVEATSQKDIDGIAARRLAAITGGGDYVDVQYSPEVDLWRDDLVHVVTAAGDDYMATANELEIPEHGLVRAKLRKVVALA